MHLSLDFLSTLETGLRRAGEETAAPDGLLADPELLLERFTVLETVHRATFELQMKRFSG